VQKQALGDLLGIGIERKETRRELSIKPRLNLIPEFVTREAEGKPLSVRQGGDFEARQWVDEGRGVRGVCRSPLLIWVSFKNLKIEPSQLKQKLGDFLSTYRNRVHTEDANLPQQFALQGRRVGHDK